MIFHQSRTPPFLKSIATKFSEWPNETSCIFLSFKINTLYPTPTHGVVKVIFNFKSQLKPLPLIRKPKGGLTFIFYQNIFYDKTDMFFSWLFYFDVPFLWYISQFQLEPTHKIKLNLKLVSAIFHFYLSIYFFTVWWPLNYYETRFHLI